MVRFLVISDFDRQEVGGLLVVKCVLIDLCDLLQVLRSKNASEMRFRFAADMKR